MLTILFSCLQNVPVTQGHRYAVSVFNTKII